MTTAIAYSKTLLSSIPESNGIVPEPPEFVAGKMPSDVYRRLLTCLDRVERIEMSSNRKPFTLGPLTDNQIDSSAPSDVYDIACIIVAELAYLHSENAHATRPVKVYPPGRQFPSDVFQRVGILEKQLIELEEMVSRHPSWLD